MSPTLLSARRLIPVHDSGCTTVCVTAAVRLVTALRLRFLPVMRLPWGFSSASSVSSRQRTGCLTGSCSPIPALDPALTVILSP